MYTKSNEIFAKKSYDTTVPAGEHDEHHDTEHSAHE